MTTNGKARRAPRVLILSANIGEGHELPARVLAAGVRRLEPGATVEIVDGLAAMGKLVFSAVESGSRFSFRWMNWFYDLEYWLITRSRLIRRAGLELAYAIAERRLLPLIRAHRPDVVVSTYPGVIELLGMLRERGRLRTPAVAAITDLSGLDYWAHRGVDLHLITHPESLEEVNRLAPGAPVRAVQGLTQPGFTAPGDRAAARRSFGLPAAGPVVLVSGGGWGVGDLESAVRVALGIPGTSVACLCGHNERLRATLAQRFGTDPRVRLLGFTDSMPDLLDAADALVHSTAGLTVLEANLRGCPAISYGWGIGHIRANNRAYARFGIAAVAPDAVALERALRDALARPRLPDERLAALPGAADAVLALGAAPSAG